MARPCRAFMASVCRPHSCPSKRHGAPRAHQASCALPHVQHRAELEIGIGEVVRVETVPTRGIIRGIGVDALARRVVHLMARICALYRRQVNSDARIASTCAVYEASAPAPQSKLVSWNAAEPLDNRLSHTTRASIELAVVVGNRIQPS